MPIGGTAFFGQNQSPRITTNYLNQSSRTGDPAPGVNVSTAQISGSIVQPYDGFCGGKLTITGPWAQQLADPSVGPLYGGIYQYVQLDPTLTAAPARGQVLFWADEENYIVTTAGTPAPSKVAGIAINPDTPGNWDFIQIMGIANVLFGAAAVANGAMVGTDPTATPAVAQAATVINPDYLGITVAAAVANAVNPVQLNLQAGYNQ